MNQKGIGGNKVDVINTGLKKVGEIVAVVFSVMTDDIFI